MHLLKDTVPESPNTSGAPSARKFPAEIGEDVSPGTGEPVYTLTLRPLRSDVPAANRLRQALKRLLRDYQLRCEDVREVPVVSPPSYPLCGNAVNP